MKNNKKGAAQGGAVNAEDPAAKEVKADAKKDYEGSPRMGYTQNFGPSRQGGYSKGAAKVNSIMGNGPAQLSTKDIQGFSDFSKKAVAARKEKATSELKESAYLDSLNLAVNQGRGEEAKQLYGTEYKGYPHQTLSEAGHTSATRFQAKGEEHAQNVINEIVNMSAAANTKKKKLNLPKA